MKQLSIAFNAPNINIPINYHHEVQSLIYHLLRDADDEVLHDHVTGVGMRQYKLFTFSSLRGRSSVRNKRITFDEIFYLDVRSVRDVLCDSLESALKKSSELQLCGQELTLHFVKSEERTIMENKLHIKMLSPLEVHTTDADNRTSYFTPLDQEFSKQINANFKRKWTAYTGNPPVGDIDILAINVSAKDKYVTSYKGIYINGWRGEYTLSGNPEYLNFLYHGGLGARNSDGFGMFEVIS
ncbi:MAG: CRISPR-associated endoribonuclease Cas6 [Oscillospiraceae bacterium]|nr:CRISPR-associated endoribonuclease Cas6 [Oscillospiraceae bacterium]